MFRREAGYLRYPPSFVCHNRADRSSKYLPSLLITTWTLSAFYCRLVSCLTWLAWSTEALPHSTNISPPPLSSQWLGQMFPLVSSYVLSQGMDVLSAFVVSNTDDTSGLCSFGRKCKKNCVLLLNVLLWCTLLNFAFDF